MVAQPPGDLNGDGLADYIFDEARAGDLQDSRSPFFGASARVSAIRRSRPIRHSPICMVLREDLQIQSGGGGSTRTGTAYRTSTIQTAVTSTSTTADRTTSRSSAPCRYPSPWATRLCSTGRLRVRDGRGQRQPRRADGAPRPYHGLLRRRPESALPVRVRMVLRRWFRRAERGQLARA